MSERRYFDNHLGTFRNTNYSNKSYDPTQTLEIKKDNNYS